MRDSALDVVREHALYLDLETSAEPFEGWGRHELDLPETYPTGV